jgi:hypothetical protein
MRMLKQALLALCLLVVAYITLALVRLGHAPAQGPPTTALRNGDVNCDGKLDISDPIVTLNWLFSDGPEPCAMAQADTCCQDLRNEVAELRATVDSLAARIPGPNDLMALRGMLRFTKNEPRILIEVPEGKRFVVTSFWWVADGAIGAKLASVTDGQPTLIPVAPLTTNSGGAYASYSSGFAFPARADVGVVLDAFFGPMNAEYYINGYLAAE